MTSDELYQDINFEGIDEDLAAFQEDEAVQQALHRGVDLKKYGNELEQELRKAEMESVRLYVQHGNEVLALHQDMEECDRILGKMEEMLHGFQADLGEISSEIKHLQEDSQSMSVKLKNRRNVEDKIHVFLEHATLPPAVGVQISSPHVNESFLDAVVLLGKRITYLEQPTAPRDGSSSEVPPNDTLYAKTLLPDLEKLKIKAISKIKDYFTNQITAIRKPKTNVQMVQQNALVKYAPLYTFVSREATMVAEDLRNMYIEAMSKTIQNLFKNYYTQLMKLETIIATKTDLIAVEETALKSLFTQKIDMTKRSDTFALGEREKVLENIEATPILVHIALAENQKVPYEVLFRSILKHLVDAATNEFLFVIDFFATQPKDTFNKIFGRTIQQLLESIETHLTNCYDIVGLLLMIKISFHLRLVMQRRRIPVLDPFFDRLSLLLWPRFKQLFDANLKSLKSIGPTLGKGLISSAGSSMMMSMTSRNSVHGGGTAATTATGGIDTLSPHYISRRYAELVASITSLQMSNMTGNSVGMENQSTMSTDTSITGGGDLMIQNDLQLLRQEMITAIERIAAGITSVKDQRVFFINNYDMILSVFQERRLTSEEVQRFEALLVQQREWFAEEEVSTFFPKLRQFVLQTELQVYEASNNGTNQKVQLDDTVVEGLVKEFAATWRTGMQQVNDDVLTYFANFRNGMEILKQVLTQLLLYYTRFQDLIKKSYSRPPSFSREIISTATILMEIKRYSRTF